MVRALRNLVVHRSAALLSVDMLLLFVATNVLQHYLIRLNIDVVGHSANQITVPILATIMATLAIATMGFYQWDFCWDRLSRSEEHKSELQSPCNLVCRLLLEKK